MAEPTGSPDRAARRHAATRRRWLIVGGAVAVVAIVALVVVLATGGSDDNSEQAGTNSTATTGSEAEGSTAPTSGPTTTTNDATPVKGGVCRGTQLAGEQMNSGITGGLQTAVFGFTNTSQAACTLTGSPEIALLDANGSPLPTVVTVGGGAVPVELVAQPVNLDPGAQASILISWDTGSAVSDAGCSSARAVSFTMPESKGVVKVDTRLKACNGGALNVSPIQPGIVAG